MPEPTVDFPAHSPQGYFAHLSYKRDGDYEHFLGGAQSWADCPNCQKPMLQLMSLDLRDPRLGLCGTGISNLPLLFCWTCSQQAIAYSFDPRGACRLLTYRRAAPEKDFPYPDYPVAFDATPLRLIPIPPDLQHVLLSLNEDEADDWKELGDYLKLDRPRHQVGGAPYLVQHNMEERHRCPSCSLEAPFLAAISDEAGHNRSFVGNAWVQVVVHFCARCRIAISYQQCD